MTQFPCPCPHCKTTFATYQEWREHLRTEAYNELLRNLREDGKKSEPVQTFNNPELLGEA